MLFPGANHSDAVERAFNAHGEGWFPRSASVLLQNEINPQAIRYAMEHAGDATVIFKPVAAALSRGTACIPLAARRVARGQR